MGATASAGTYADQRYYPDQTTSSDHRRLSMLPAFTSDAQRRRSSAAHPAPIRMLVSPAPPHPPSRPPPPRPESTRYNVPRRDSWDETRDFVFSRILGAEEFLTRLLEQDESLRVVSQMPDRERYTTHIAEILGLRGHLNNELLRIQQMLAENDPQLKCIAEFEVSHAAVVEKLRELRDESERLKSASTSTNGGGTGTDAMTDTDILPGLGIGEMGTTTGTNTGECDGTQDGDSGGGDGMGQRGQTFAELGIETEDDLHIKHSEEENKMASRYAKLIAHGQQMSLDEINSLLSDHARNVQALKMKQEQERERFRAQLEARRRERAGGSGDVSSDGGSSIDLNGSISGRTSSARARRRNKMTRRDSEQSLTDSAEKNRTRIKTTRTEPDMVDIDGMLRNHSAALHGIRAKQEQERKKFEDLLQRKKLSKNRQENNLSGEDEDDDDEEGTSRYSTDSGIDATSGNPTDDALQSVVQTLEALRLRGELNEDVVARLMSKYYAGLTDGPDGGAPTQEGRRMSKAANRQPTSFLVDKESASRLVHETQKKQKEIQTKRQQEKEMVEAKLRQKLAAKNQRRYSEDDDIVSIDD